MCSPHIPPLPSPPTVSSPAPGGSRSCAPKAPMAAASSTTPGTYDSRERRRKEAAEDVSEDPWLL